jgi:predicted metalloprotease with PDZ domain
LEKPEALVINNSLVRLVVLLCLLCLTIPSRLRAQNGSTAMILVVDETQAARRIAFVHEEIAVSAGPLALAYPKWIPGEHGPTGPLQQVAAIHLRTAQTSRATLPWMRDPDDISTIHLEVPSGTTRITLDFDVLLENTISDHQLLLAWNAVVLYPRAADKRALMIEPSVLLPSGWKQGSSLKVSSQSGSHVDFAPVSLERLIDSPVLAGEFFRAVPLGSKWPAVLEITGDSPAAVAKADDAHAFRMFESLVDQDRAMFGYRHWQTLHLLVSQSVARPYDGLEHEDSPYNALTDAALSKADQLEEFGLPLLAHELSHSWIGKYRRAEEMYSKTDYQGPERTSLLWVYEGLNTYAGTLLATRAGFNDAEYVRESFANWAASLSYQPARAFTALVDTATQNWILRTVDNAWSSLRRGQDYYFEGALIWLEADAIIRERSDGQRSLDDFLRSFFGQRDTEPIVVPYTRADVEAGLAEILPYDWHAFFETRVYQVNEAPPTKGLEAAGWKLEYSEAPNRDRFLPPGFEAQSIQLYSIGAFVKTDGTIADVLPGSPAYEAGLGPHMTILAVNDRTFSLENLAMAISHPIDGSTIAVTVKNFDSVLTRQIRYGGGLRYPHLVRIPDRQDYLTKLLKPLNVD